MSDVSERQSYDGGEKIHGNVEDEKKFTYHGAVTIVALNEKLLDYSQTTIIPRGRALGMVKTSGGDSFLLS